MEAYCELTSAKGASSFSRGKGGANKVGKKAHKTRSSRVARNLFREGYGGRSMVGVLCSILTSSLSLAYDSASGVSTCSALGHCPDSAGALSSSHLLRLRRKRKRGNQDVRGRDAQDNFAFPGRVLQPHGTSTTSRNSGELQKYIIDGRLLSHSPLRAALVGLRRTINAHGHSGPSDDGPPTRTACSALF